MSKQIISMLFTDIKGYSSITNSDLKDSLATMLENEFEKTTLNENNHIFYKTWGDAYFIAGNDPVELAYIALKLRDYFMQKNWIVAGFPQQLKIRMGLHVDRVIVKYDSNGIVKDVLGGGVDKTARIEPITAPNTVYCSHQFYEYIKQDSPYQIKGMSKGLQPLAKKYGELELFELMWSHETSENKNSIKSTSSKISDLPIPMPSNAIEFSEKQKRDYVDASYQILKNYFDKAVSQLTSSNQHYEATIKEVSNVRFIVEIYESGKLKVGCALGIGSQAGYGIYYKQGGHTVDFYNPNSWNDLLTPEIYESKLFLKMSFGDSGIDRNKRYVPTDAAESLWKRLIKWL